jgi:predicted nucleic acid-binding Zn ribbon protein
MKRDKDRTKPIKDVVSGVIKEWGEERLVKEEALRKAWCKAVGRKTAPHTRIRSFRAGKLIIEIDASGWMYELTLKKQTILKKLRTYLKDSTVEELQFRIGDFT